MELSVKDRLYLPSFLPARGNFKEKTLKKIGIQALRVYLQGNNLCVWDDIKMWDPELGNTNGGFSYPLSRTFTFGLDFTF